MTDTKRVTVERISRIVFIMALGVFLYSGTVIMVSSDSKILNAEKNAIKVKRLLKSARDMNVSFGKTDINIKDTDGKWIVKLSLPSADRERMMFLLSEEFPGIIVMDEGDVKDRLLQQSGGINSSPERNPSDSSVFESWSKNAARWIFLLLIAVGVVVFSIRGYRQVSHIRKQQKSFKDQQNKLQKELKKGAENV